MGKGGRGRGKDEEEDRIDWDTATSAAAYDKVWTDNQDGMQGGADDLEGVLKGMW